MILVSVVIPVLLIYLVFLYITLVRRFFMVKSRLPFTGLKDGIGHLVGRRRWLAVFGTMYFLIYFAGRVVMELWSPDMLMVFHYEEAARGLNPNVTRFNESDILSEHILEEVIRRGGLRVSKDRLADLLTLSTPLDREALDITQESDLKISTEYWVHCSEQISLYGTDPRTVLNLLADVYWEDFVLNYGENDSVLDLSFEELDGMEYLDVRDYLEMQANKLKDYLPGYSRESSSFRVEESGETFASLSQKIDNFINIELERYEAFVLENGLALNRGTYRARMQYANRILDTSRKKDMAAHDVRIETIHMYDAFMTRFVLIPTYDTDREFYMSKTKVGVDYFADEAKEHLESATELMEEMEHNTYASSQIGTSQATEEIYARADQQTEGLKTELMNLAVQCRALCDSYVKEKRDGYIQMCFSSPSMVDEAVKAVWPTVLFVIAQGGIVILDPFYEECCNSRADERKARKLAKKREKKQIKEARRMRKGIRHERA